MWESVEEQANAWRGGMGLPIGEGGVERLGVLIRTGDVGITRRLGKHSTLNDVVRWNCLLVGAGG